MADDGLLMNFAVDDTPAEIKTVFRGGHWKDRVRAKKSLVRRSQKHHNVNAAVGTEENVASSKPENALLNGDTSPPSKRQKRTENSSSSRVSQSSSTKSAVISSLFTSNPSAKTTPHISTIDQEAVSQPSNAPLPDGAIHFTSLGVNPALASHLLTSLKLKTPTAIQKAAIAQLLKGDSDAFIQAETGSGKTLAYLIPIIQHLMSLRALCTNEKISRKSGLFALILVPTRELAKQVDVSLSELLTRLPWLVHGTVTGGSTKNHEKARIRKGVNILVATPGRLVDHIENTEALDLFSVRWLVLDEGDRLVELGFEADIKTIIAALKNQKPGKDATNPESRVEPQARTTGSLQGLPQHRRNILCSATMKIGVQRLGDLSLKDAKMIKPEDATKLPEISGDHNDSSEQTQKENSKPALLFSEEIQRPFLAPSQLRQAYIIAPAKQRLVTLYALLKRSFARKGSVTKVIVFLSCADSVDFHFEVLRRGENSFLSPEKVFSDFAANNKKALKQIAQKSPKEQSAIGTGPDNQNLEHDRPPQSSRGSAKHMSLPTISTSNTLSSPANPTLQLFKLHGSLPQALRTATLSCFSRTTTPSVLLCTDVASRGLDLPNIDFVIEYDPPFSSDEHLHRVGRTARAGREGRAVCFLMPGAEEGYVEVLKSASGTGKGNLKGETAEEVLRKGFEARVATGDVGAGGHFGGKWDEQATEWQLEVERWVVDHEQMGEMAKKAYVSHVRAYATHVVKERGMFDVKDLHLGHLAKAFALREKPGSLGRFKGEADKDGSKDRRGEKRRLNGRNKGKEQNANPSDEVYQKARPDWRGKIDPSEPSAEAARKMRAKLKEHLAGAEEFNIG
ncbi:uncharacterized protein KY384_007718 [Bacidia gigantensis]|uniref:uncharacterized protein n=1 Tax=Bacidia gigantensis TaxID=2732470 RepID=UPI001D055937|nr:uncharacterized protein KY384_007718 [Bacidia gigantensis]KAG8527565.1 hypothetical protein KY384_007718 [Bacidia gigantensis]